MDKLGNKDWYVYAKPPFGGPEHVPGYLGRYTHRMAISNRRLTAFDGENVSYRWRDYAHGNKQRIMTLKAEQFLRRFFLHLHSRRRSSKNTFTNIPQPLDRTSPVHRFAGLHHQRRKTQQSESLNQPQTMFNFHNPN